MTSVEIIGSVLSGGAGVKIFEWIRAMYRQNSQQKKTEAETDVLVSDSWEKLFKQVSTEWHTALETIKRLEGQYDELKEALDKEKLECAQSMFTLRQQIEQLKNK